MSKEQCKRLIYLVLIIVWMITVFMFSNQNGDESQKTSKSVTEKVVQVLTYNKAVTESEKLKLINDTDYIVRKLAHFSIYTLGGILIYNYINTFELKPNKKYIIPIMIGVLYATLDEFHQYFISERSAQILDVCIDTLGIIIGIILISLIKKWEEVYYERKGCRNN